MGSVLELENRYIIHKGLHNIKNTFFKQLLQKQSYSITGEVSPDWDTIIAKTNPISVAFYIVPLVNSIVRVGSIEDKELMFRAFLNGDEEVPCNKRGAKGTMEKAGIEVARIATNARAAQNRQLDAALSMVEAKIFKYDLLENKILTIVLEDEQFPSELNGLLAMQCAAKYKKPTLVMRRGVDGIDKGSMRGLNQSELKDLKAFLTESGYFDYVSGHANAAGVGIAHYDLEKFLDYSNKKLKDVDFGENYYDVNFLRKGTDKDIGAIIEDLSEYDELWGQQNNQPLVCVTDIIIDSNAIRIMGANKDTVKIEYNGISYMKFHAKKFIEEIQNLNRFKLTVIGRANLNHWSGRVYPQIFIDDYEIIAAPTDFGF